MLYSPARTGAGDAGHTIPMGGSTIFRELRRRQFFRIVAVYAATDWLVLQPGAIVFPALHAPGWCLAVLIGFVAPGIPVTLVLGWAFEVSPDGVRRTEPADSAGAGDAQERPRVAQLLNLATMVILCAAVRVLAWHLTSDGRDLRGLSRQQRSARCLVGNGRFGEVVDVVDDFAHLEGDRRRVRSAVFGLVPTFDLQPVTGWRRVLAVPVL